MFSTIPKTGTSILFILNIFTPFSASAKAISCGVLIITAPVIGIA
jgi:hypothetical protein